MDTRFQQKRSKGHNSKAIPQPAVRNDNFDYFPVCKEKRGRCKLPGCKSSPFFFCHKCEDYLCTSKTKNCLQHFHKNKLWDNSRDIFACGMLMNNFLVMLILRILKLYIWCCAVWGFSVLCSARYFVLNITFITLFVVFIKQLHRAGLKKQLSRINTCIQNALILSLSCEQCANINFVKSLVWPDSESNPDLPAT